MKYNIILSALLILGLVSSTYGANYYGFKGTFSTKSLEVPAENSISGTILLNITRSSGFVLSYKFELSGLNGIAIAPGSLVFEGPAPSGQTQQNTQTILPFSTIAATGDIHSGSGSATIQTGSQQASALESTLDSTITSSSKYYYVIVKPQSSKDIVSRAQLYYSVNGTTDIPTTTTSSSTTTTTGEGSTTSTSTSSTPEGQEGVSSDNNSGTALTPQFTIIISTLLFFLTTFVLSVV